MKKNGFVFVETIVSIVILTSALLLLYTSFHKILQVEKTRVYYDNVNYIYRTYHALNLIKNVYPFSDIKNDLNKEEKNYVIFGSEASAASNNPQLISDFMNDFEISKMVFFSKDKIQKIKKCKNNSTNNSSSDDLCSSLNVFSEDMVSFLKTVNNIEKSYVFENDNGDLYRYFFVVEYNVCNSNNRNCRNYYSWVGVI